MIIGKFQGQLGNELFIYTFLYYSSKETNSCFAVDSQNMSLPTYFELNSLNWKLINKIKLTLYYRFLKKIRKFNSIIDYQTELIPAQNNTYYIGFFQSYQYFEKYKTQLLKHFAIRSQYKFEFENTFKAFNEDYVAIHYRGGDYHNFGNDELGGKDLVLPDSFYEKAIAFIQADSQYSSLKIYVITNSPDEVKLKNWAKNAIILSNNYIVDFQILQNAKALIISNSSFAWWAANLNPKNPLVLVPNFWLGFKIKKEFPYSIINPKWNIITFN